MVNASTSSENTFFSYKPFLLLTALVPCNLPLMAVYFFSRERAEKTSFPVSPADCVPLADLSRNGENAPIASLSTGIIPIVQNSLPAAVQVRNGFSSLCNAFKPKDINYMVQGEKVPAPNFVICFCSHATSFLPWSLSKNLFLLAGSHTLLSDKWPWF